MKLCIEFVCLSISNTKTDMSLQNGLLLSFIKLKRCSISMNVNDEKWQLCLHDFQQKKMGLLEKKFTQPGQKNYWARELSKYLSSA